MHRLLQGDFVRYHYRKDSTGKTLLLPWLVNDNKDSVLHRVRPIGDPNKDGYVVLHYLFMSHLPNQPLVMYVEKIEKVSRDTLVVLTYSSPLGTYFTY